MGINWVDDPYSSMKQVASCHDSNMKVKRRVIRAMYHATHALNVDLKTYTVCISSVSTVHEPVSVSVPAENTICINIWDQWDSIISEANLLSKVSGVTLRGLYSAVRRSAYPFPDDVLAERFVSEGLSRAFAYELGYPLHPSSTALSQEDLDDYASGLKKYVGFPYQLKIEPELEKARKSMQLYVDGFNFTQQNEKEFGVVTPSFAGVTFATALAFGWCQLTKRTALQSRNDHPQYLVEAFLDGSLDIKAPMRDENSRQPISRVLSYS